MESKTSIDNDFVKMHLSLHKKIDTMVIDDVDAHLAVLSKTMRLLQSRRNNLVAIAALPSDLLLQIFLHLPAHIASGQSAHIPIPQYLFRIHVPIPRKVTHTFNGVIPDDAGLERMHVSHVCRGWRELCLASPLLWTFLSSDVNPNYLEKMLERTRGAPVALYLKTPKMTDFSAHYALADAAALESYRVRTLRILQQSVSTAEFVHNILPTLKAHPWPVLHHLSIVALGRSQPPVTLATCIESAPQLRSLSLYGCRMTWNSSLVVNLTSLEVAYADGPGNTPLSPRPSCAEMAKLFSQSPRLRRLALKYALPPVTVEDAMLPVLHELRDLLLVDEPAVTSRFATTLRAPSLKCYQLVVWLLEAQGSRNVSVGDSEVAEIYSALMALSRTCTLQDMSRAELILPETVLRGWLDTHFTEAPAVGITLESMCSYMAFPTLVGAASSLLMLPIFSAVTDLTVVPQLRLTDTEWTHNAPWLEIFRATPLVRILRIRGLDGLKYYASSLEPGLADISPLLDTLAGAPGNTPLPALRSIEVCHAQMRAISIKNPRDPTAPYLMSGCEDAMTACLEMRRASGLEHVMIAFSFSMTDELLQKWRQNFPGVTVDWDGVEPRNAPKETDIKGWSLQPSDDFL